MRSADAVAPSEAPRPVFQRLEALEMVAAAAKLWRAARLAIDRGDTTDMSALYDARLGLCMALGDLRRSEEGE